MCALLNKGRGFYTPSYLCPTTDKGRGGYEQKAYGAVGRDCRCCCDGSRGGRSLGEGARAERLPGEGCGCATGEGRRRRSRPRAQETRRRAWRTTRVIAVVQRGERGDTSTPSGLPTWTAGGA